MYPTVKYKEGEEQYSYGYTKNLEIAITTNRRRGYSIWIRTGDVGFFGGDREINLQIVHDTTLKAY